MTNMKVAKCLLCISDSISIIISDLNAIIYNILYIYIYIYIYIEWAITTDK